MCVPYVGGVYASDNVCVRVMFKMCLIATDVINSYQIKGMFNRHPNVFGNYYIYILIHFTKFNLQTTPADLHLNRLFLAYGEIFRVCVRFLQQHSISLHPTTHAWVNVSR